MQKLTPDQAQSRSRKKWAGVALAVIAALAGALLTPSAASAATPVSGQVTYNGVGVANVVTYFYLLNPTTGSWSYQDTADAATNAAGQWAYTDTLPDGTYSLFYDTSTSNAIYASDQGRNGVRLTSKLNPEFSVSGGVASLTVVPSTPLTVNSGAVQVSLRNALTGGLISAPASTNGFAQVYNGSDSAGDPVSGNYVGESTGFDGIILVGGVEPGTYYDVYGGADGYTTGFAAGPFTVALGQTVTGPDVGLYPDTTPSILSQLPSPKVVTVGGVPKVGTVLTATVPTSGAAVTYQWYSGQYGETVIPGATAQTYVPTAKQLGEALTVRATFNAPGYASAQLYSEATKRVVLGDPNVATVTLAGTAAFGKTLTINVAAQTVSDSKYNFAWYRNGAPIAGATGSTYTLQKADVGQKVFASVTSFAQGHNDGVLPSNTATVAKEKGSVTVKADKSISTSTKLKVTVTLKDGASGNNATGKVRVYYTTKKFKTATFTSKSKSKTVTLPKLSKGKHVIKVKYLGDSHYSAKSVNYTVTVK